MRNPPLEISISNKQTKIIPQPPIKLSEQSNQLSAT